MKDFTPTSYTLECVATGREFEDTGWMLSDPQCKTPLAHPREICPQAARSETRRIRSLPVLRLDARAAYPQGLLGARHLQKQGACRPPRAGKPLDHVQRLLSGHRRHDVYLFVQGDRGLFGLRACRRTRGSRPCGRLGGQYGPRLRQGVFRQQYQAAPVGALRQYQGRCGSSIRSTPA